MLNDVTVIAWGEFGRTPWSQDLSGTAPLETHGREHQPESFTGFLVGGTPRLNQWTILIGSLTSAKTANTGTFYIVLKPRDQRDADASEVIDRLTHALTEAAFAGHPHSEGTEPAIVGALLLSGRAEVRR